MLIDNDASSGATVVEVHAPDLIGVLYRITRALAELDIDIRTAKVQTLGDQVVDAFYSRSADGEKVTDAATRPRWSEPSTPWDCIDLTSGARLLATSV